MLEYRRRLPHFHLDDAYLFLTWRLWGSWPAHPPSSRPYLTPGHAFVAADRALDRAGAGPMWLKDHPRIARLLVGPLWPAKWIPWICGRSPARDGRRNRLPHHTHICHAQATNVETPEKQLALARQSVRHTSVAGAQSMWR